MIEQILIARSLTDNEVRHALAECYHVSPSFVHSMETVLEHQLEARVVYEYEVINGDFLSDLSIYPQSDGLRDVSSEEILKQLCWMFGSDCLVPDKSRNPYSMILIQPSGKTETVFLDVDQLDEEDRVVLADRLPLHRRIPKLMLHKYHIARDQQTRDWIESVKQSVHLNSVTRDLLGSKIFYYKDLLSIVEFRDNVAVTGLSAMTFIAVLFSGFYLLTTLSVPIEHVVQVSAMSLFIFFGTVNIINESVFGYPSRLAMFRSLGSVGMLICLNIWFFPTSGSENLFAGLTLAAFKTGFWTAGIFSLALVCITMIYKILDYFLDRLRNVSYPDYPLLTVRLLNLLIMVEDDKQWKTNKAEIFQDMERIFTRLQYSLPNDLLHKASSNAQETNAFTWFKHNLWGQTSYTDAQLIAVSDQLAKLLRVTSNVNVVNDNQPQAYVLARVNQCLLSLNEQNLSLTAPNTIFGFPRRVRVWFIASIVLSLVTLFSIPIPIYQSVLVIISLMVGMIMWLYVFINWFTIPVWFVLHLPKLMWQWRPEITISWPEMPHISWKQKLQPIWQKIVQFFLNPNPKNLRYQT